MSGVFKAIFDWIAADAQLTGYVSNRVYQGRAPQVATYPYIVFHLIDQTANEFFQYSRRIEIFRIQFSIFSQSSSAEEAGDIFKALTTRFDRAVLSFTGSDFKSIGTVRESANLIREEEEVWHYAVDYVLYLHPLD